MSKWHVGEAVGLELEYMIVDSETLSIKPMVEEILKDHNRGQLVDEIEVGNLKWSNELVCHVIELKGDGPFKNYEVAYKSFDDGVKKLNGYLKNKNCRLLPTAMHPWMNPAAETVLWPHGQKEIYAQFNKIFGCQGHGWSNLQSMHINLPYANEEEFGRLHAAVRLVLPLIPALCASSPISDGKLGDYPSQRLKHYESNQSKIPLITGKVIPEPVFTFGDYEKMLQSMYKQIAPHDPEGVLQHPWLNSRGAIAKFDYGCIEIRVADVQEIPRMDVSIACFIETLIKRLVHGEFLNYEMQKKVSTDVLADAYLKANSFKAQAISSEYWKVWQGTLPASACNSYVELISGLFEKVGDDLPLFVQNSFEQWLVQGSLASRIRAVYLRDGDLKNLYQQLALCLSEDQLFKIY